MARSRVALLLALSISISISILPVPALSEEFHVIGRVYCDTCQAGFETNVTTYIQGAKVKVLCRDRKSMQRLYSVEGETDETGTYNITVKGDRHDQMCHCELLSCSLEGCNRPDPGRCKSTVALTRTENGLMNTVQHANAMGCFKDQPLDGCKHLLNYYLADV
ncbi:hypothetical protein L6164_012362 [Bauhinia variegata]|uniref:Uncharacterized protein n=1 Tax=Bauhinia variegata TaxID=167791 RepID=A0ACB9P8Y5_BAUVA|nr:hypothetical protein L6164_012362 [Bauhinia variegata]